MNLRTWRGLFGAALLAAGVAAWGAHVSVASYTPAIAVGQRVYAGGDAVSVTGAGFAPNDLVTVQVTHTGGATEAGMGHDAFTVTADEAGAFETSWTLPADDPGVDGLEARATGATAGEATAAAFTRGPVAETDALTYRAGDIVTVSGRGFGAGEAVTLQVTHAGGGTEPGMGHEATDLTVYLEDGLSGHGYGSALYTELFARLRTRGVHAVIGGIAQPNEASVRIHEKFGMRKVAHFEQVGFKFGRWVDVAFWERVLG